VVRGRHPKLTPKIQQDVVVSLLAGNFANTAAKYAGLHPATFWRYMKLGSEAESGPYREFYDAVTKAESESEVRAVALLRKHAEKQFQAAAWWLERKYPKRWGRKERLELTGSGGGPVQVAPTALREQLRSLPLSELKLLGKLVEQFPDSVAIPAGVLAVPLGVGDDGGVVGEFDGLDPGGPVFDVESVPVAGAAPGGPAGGPESLPLSLGSLAAGPGGELADDGEPALGALLGGSWGAAGLGVDDDAADNGWGS
jgi:hypothetical protein